MKAAVTPTRFDTLFCAVSTSLLLASPLDVFAFEPREDDPFTQVLVSPRLTSLWRAPSNANGLSQDALAAFSEQMSERHGLGVADLVAQQWAQYAPGAARPDAQEPAQHGTFDPQLMIAPDLFVRESAAGNVHRAGIFVGHSNLQSQFTRLRPLLGNPPRSAVNLSGESLGLYWSMTHVQGWHVDAVAMGTRIDISGRSDSGQRLDDSGHAMTFSVEGGFPIGLGGNWVIEPQAQLINQQFFPGSQTERQTLHVFDNAPSWSGRVGAKLSTRYEVRGMPIEPYVRTSLWYDFSNYETVKLDQVDKISSSRSSATVELGLGLVARVTSNVALFVSADYSSDVDDNDLNGLIGSLGVRMRW